MFAILLDSPWRLGRHGVPVSAPGPTPDAHKDLLNHIGQTLGSRALPTAVAWLLLSGSLAAQAAGRPRDELAFPRAACRSAGHRGQQRRPCQPVGVGPASGAGALSRGPPGPVGGQRVCPAGVRRWEARLQGWVVRSGEATPRRPPCSSPRAPPSPSCAMPRAAGAPGGPRWVPRPDQRPWYSKAARWPPARPGSLPVSCVTAASPNRSAAS